MHVTRVQEILDRNQQFLDSKAFFGATYVGHKMLGENFQDIEFNFHVSL